MTGTPRWSAAKLDRLIDTLSQRDRAILSDLARVRVLTGSMLTRLHFHNLTPASQDRSRRRVLNRLTVNNLVATLDRRIGGSRAGSAGLVYSLGLAGQRITPLLAAGQSVEPPARARQPWTPGVMFLSHTLDIAELFVQLREQERARTIELASFATEPDTWVSTGHGGYLKPDAYAVLRHGNFEDAWWLEVDRATESLPTLRRKLLGYVDYVLSGQTGVDGGIPRVLVTVPHTKRLVAVLDLITSLPEPAERLISCVLFERATGFVVDAIRGGSVVDSTVVQTTVTWHNQAMEG